MEMKLYTFETIVYIYSMLWHPVIISEIFLIKKSLFFFVFFRGVNFNALMHVINLKKFTR